MKTKLELYIKRIEDHLKLGYDKFHDQRKIEIDKIRNNEFIKKLVEHNSRAGALLVLLRLPEIEKNPEKLDDLLMIPVLNALNDYIIIAKQFKNQKVI